MTNAILRPADEYQEKIEETVRVNPTQLKNRLAQVYTDITEIIKSEDNFTTPVTGAQAVPGPYWMDSVVKVFDAINSTEVARYCYNLKGTLPSFDHNSPHNLLALMDHFNLDKILIASEVHGNLSYSGAYPLLQWNPSKASKFQRDLLLFKRSEPNSDKPYTTDGVFTGQRSKATCIFKQRTPESPLTKVMQGLIKQMRTLSGSLKGLSNGWETAIVYLPTTLVMGPHEEFKFPMEKIEELESVVKVLKYSTPTLNVNDVLELRMLLNAVEEVMDNYQVKGRSIYFRTHDGADWDSIRLVSKHGNWVLGQRKAGSVVDVKVYTIDSLYLTDSEPFLEIEDKFFIDQGGSNFTTSVFPVKKRCEFDRCETVLYGKRNPECAASLVKGSGEHCERKRASASRIVTASCEPRFVAVMTPSEVQVITKCGDQNTATPSTKILGAGLTRLASDCRVYYSEVDMTMLGGVNPFQVIEKGIELYSVHGMSIELILTLTGVGGVVVTVILFWAISCCKESAWGRWVSRTRLFRFFARGQEPIADRDLELEPMDGRRIRVMKNNRHLKNPSAPRNENSTFYH